MEHIIQNYPLKLNLIKKSDMDPTDSLDSVQSEDGYATARSIADVCDDIFVTAVEQQQEANKVAALTLSSNSSHRLCRICRCDSSSAPLIQCPCKCKGSVGFVHETCLQRWHIVRKAKICEICKEEYDFADMVIDR